MNNNDKMLQLVLSDEKLRSFFEYKSDEYVTIRDALNAENPIVVSVAKIILGVGGNSDKGAFKETYNEIFNYLNKNLV